MVKYSISKYCDGIIYIYIQLWSARKWGYFVLFIIDLSSFKIHQQPETSFIQYSSSMQLCLKPLNSVSLGKNAQFLRISSTPLSIAPLRRVWWSLDDRVNEDSDCPVIWRFLWIYMEPCNYTQSVFWILCFSGVDKMTALKEVNGRVIHSLVSLYLVGAQYCFLADSA